MKMSNETTKASSRRHSEEYYTQYFQGKGIDIGCGPDPITSDCIRWDLEQGDAQYLVGLSTHSFDWVYSSHCLEHMQNPAIAISRWWEVLKPGGYMLVVIPDEDLYEQGIWPSRFNSDHKWTFTVHKSRSWSPVSMNVSDLVSILPNHKTIWIRTCSNGYDFEGGIWDRTLGDAEANIELLVQKLP